MADDDKKIEEAYFQEAGKEVRKDFYRDVSKAIEKAPRPLTAEGQNTPHMFGPKDQAVVLRQMADQLDKAESKEGAVKRTEARIAERDAGRFFKAAWKEPAKPTPEMRAKWLADAAKRRDGQKPTKNRDDERER